jgi:hypothetical protein
MFFGKQVSEYLRFQRVWLALLAAIGLARLALSLGGLPDRTVAAGTLRKSTTGRLGAAAPEREVARVPEARRGPPGRSRQGGAS